MDWIHCNLCFSQPVITSREQQFYLTNCGHIFCHTCGICFLNESTQRCKVCGQSCSAVKLNGETNPRILQYFDEPENMVNHLLEVIKFQRHHQARLLKHQHYMLQRHKRVKQYVKKLENELRTISLKTTPKSSNNPQTPTAFKLKTSKVPLIQLETPKNSSIPKEEQHNVHIFK